MFERSLFKDNAKQALKRFYWLGIVATLLALLLGGSGAVQTLGNVKVNGIVNYANPQFLVSLFQPREVGTYENYIPEDDVLEVIDPFPDQTFSEAADIESDFDEFASALDGDLGSSHGNALFSVIITCASVLALASLAVVILLYFFLRTQIEVGYRRFFLSARENPAEINDMFWSYKHSIVKTIGTLLRRDIILVLWTMPVVVLACALVATVSFNPSSADAAYILIPIFLILMFAAIIPVVIKKYQYSMVSYLRAENTKMSVSRVLKLSKDMTKGYKWQLFLLDLSFFGWELLGVLACGIGTLFVLPYIHATQAEVYTFLKTKAIENGLAEAEEFEGFIPALVNTFNPNTYAPATTAIAEAEAE